MADRSMFQCGSDIRVGSVVVAAVEPALWLLFAMVAPGEAASVTFFATALLALWGSSLTAVKMLTVQFLLGHFNPALVGDLESGGLHLITPLLLFIKILIMPAGRAQLFQDRALLGFVACGSIAVGLQPHVSAFPALSVLKLIGFLSYATTVIVMTKVAWNRDREAVRRWYVSVVVFLIVGSLFTFGTASAHVRTTTGFNGLLSHPNGFGMVVGIGVAYLIARAWTEPRISWGVAGICVIGLIEVYMTEARGGMLSCLLALGIFFGLQANPTHSHYRRNLQRGIVALMVMVPLLLLNWERSHRTAEHFISKSGRASVVSFTEAFEASRGAAIDFHFRLIDQKPYFGHGFQVINSRSPSGLLEEETVQYDPITGRFPISAAVENGFTYTSTLAENGIIGGLLIYIGLSFVFVPILIKGIHQPEVVLLLGFLLSNTSEATLFSPGGVGGWGWLAVALAYAAARDGWQVQLGAKCVDGAETPEHAGSVVP